MKRLIGFGWLLIILVLVACGAGGENVVETAVPTQEVAAATETPEPTETAEPTETVAPTETSAPTETAVPPTEEPIAEEESPETEDPAATEEPEATATTAKPTLTPTPDKIIPTAQPLAEDDEIDALQLVLDSEDRSRGLQTSRFTQNILVLTTGFEQQVTQNCQMELPDHGYCRTDIVFTVNDGAPLETYNETVQDGEQTWLREEGGEWREVTAELAESDVISQEGLQQLTMSEFMLEANVAGETTIDGVPVYEVVFDLDVNTYVASILGEELADLFTSGAGENSGSGRTWIGQEDRLARKALIEMSFVIEGQTVFITTQVSSFGFNEPVEIPAPTGG